MDHRPLLILTAVTLEGQRLASLLKIGRGGRGPASWRGSYRGRSIAIVAMGVGAAEFPRALEDWRDFAGVSAPSPLDPPRPGGIILAGLAGGLVAQFALGAVVIDEVCGPPAYMVSLREIVGKIHSSRTVVGTPAQKAQLAAETRAVAVEMERDVLRRHLADLGWDTLPFMHVRGISDGPEESVDPAIVGLVDPIGRVKPGRLAGALLRRPSLVGDLHRLGRNAGIAADRAAHAVQALLDCGWPEGLTATTVG